MRKLKIFSVLLLLISSVAFAGYKIYENGLADNEAPVITCSEDNIQVSVADTEEKLLEGVTAEDQRDGDITDKIVVQSNPLNFLYNNLLVLSLLLLLLILLKCSFL